MCKEMSVILVNMVVYPKKEELQKTEGQGGENAQGVADPPPKKKKLLSKECRILLGRPVVWIGLGGPNDKMGRG
jgi:hypothetical protein